MQKELPKLRGLGSVRVSKKFLLAKLKENREEHKRLYEEAVAGWNTEVIKKLKSELKKAGADKYYNPSIYLPKPEDHTKEYDQVIDLLEASLDEEFELSSGEFAQYVRDDWSWKSGFIATVSGYSPQNAMR